MRDSQRGFVLLAVLWIMVAVGAAGLVLVLAARRATAAARNRMSLMAAEWNAQDCLARVQSAITQVLRAGDAKEGPVYAATSSWAALDQAVAMTPLPNDGRCTQSLVPAGITLDVNTADEDELSHLVYALGVDPPRADSLVSALLDWRDADNEARPTGAERAWYAAHRMALPANRPFTDAREIERVRGALEVQGLSSTLGVDDARILLDRAPLPVIAALPGFTAEAVARVAERRSRGASIANALDLSTQLSPSARAALMALSRSRADDYERAGCLVPHRSRDSRLARGYRGRGGAPRSGGNASRDRAATDVDRMRPVRARLGLGIGHDRVTAVLIAHDGVRWSASCSRSRERTLAEAIGLLLEPCPRAGWVAPRLHVAVGPSAVQVKHLVNLPHLEGPDALAAVVREQKGRFFLDADVRRIFSQALADGPGAAWIAAFDASVVEETTGACRRAGLRIGALAPAEIAIRAATNDARFVWTDGGVHIAVRYDDGVLCSIRRMMRIEGAGDGPQPRRDDARLAGIPHEMMDAVGAAYLPRAAPLGLRGRALMSPGAPKRSRITSSLVALAAATVFALLSPGVAAALVGHRAAIRERAVTKVATAAERDARELSATSEVLAAFQGFDAQRGSMTELLAQLTRALPEEAAVVALQIDSSNAGDIIAVAPHAVMIVDALERVPLVTSPAIVGPVTQEVHGTRTLERVTVRFHVIRLGGGGGS